MRRAARNSAPADQAGRDETRNSGPGARWPRSGGETINPAGAGVPVNVADAHYRSFQKQVLPELNRRGIGAIGMKSLHTTRFVHGAVALHQAPSGPHSQEYDHQCD